MKITVIAVGRLKSGPERELSARYFDRLAKAGPALGLAFGRIVELPESRASSAESRKREEADAVRKAAPSGGCLVLLDERGRIPTSEEFAADLGRLRDEGRRDLVVAIGGADGHDAALQAEARMLIAFGRMTWPHQLTRILIAEQLYRASTILAGHPYHRA